MFFVFILTLIIITLCVLLHYEVLTHLTETHFKRQLPTRMLLPFGVLVVIITHILEVMAFAVLFYYLFTLDGAGDIVGPFDYTLHDCVYFSFICKLHFTGLWGYCARWSY